MADTKTGFGCQSAKKEKYKYMTQIWLRNMSAWTFTLHQFKKKKRSYTKCIQIHFHLYWQYLNLTYLKDGIVYNFITLVKLEIYYVFSLATGPQNICFPPTSDPAKRKEKDPRKQTHHTKFILFHNDTESCLLCRNDIERCIVSILIHVNVNCLSGIYYRDCSCFHIVPQRDRLLAGLLLIW